MAEEITTARERILEKGIREFRLSLEADLQKSQAFLVQSRYQKGRDDEIRYVLQRLDEIMASES